MLIMHNVRILCGVSLFLMMCGFTGLTLADCEVGTIRDLAEQGKTIKAIGSFCDMEVAEVKTALRDDPDPVDNNKITSGKPSAPCGCWGAAAPGAIFPDQNCQSGYAAATMCAALCPMGGYQWRGICK